MNKLILVLFLFALVSCQKESEKGNYRIIKEEDFKVTSITSEKYYFEEVISPSNIGLVGRKVLLSEAWRVPEEHPRIHIIDSKDWTYDKPKGNADEGLFIRVGLRRDRLEIFDNRDKTFIIIDGPDLELPPFELIDANLYLGHDPRYHYRDAVVTEKYVFASYAGVRPSEYNKTAILAEQIWVFDHKGKPLWKLMLDRSINNFVINEDTNEIYGLTTDEDPGIAVFNIPKELL